MTMLRHSLSRLALILLLFPLLGQLECALAIQVGPANKAPVLSVDTAPEVLNGEVSLIDSVFGLRVALLPLADVSRGDNGINLKMTHDLAIALRGRGIDLVPEGDILQFMAENRIRFSGYLDSLLARKLGKTYDCGLVLLGTVTELSNDVDPALGLTLTVMDAKSGSPVWAATRATSVSEQVTFLGRGTPKGVEDLKAPLFQDLLNEFHKNLPKSLPERTKPYQIISARVTPGYVQGGEVMDFRLEISFVEDPPKQILLDTKLGIVPLYRAQAENLYLGHWVAPATAGAYPLTLMFDWGRGELSQKLTNVASYQVVNDPPQLQVSLKKGMKIGDITAFRGNLIILPELQGETPVNHWSLTITGERGQVFLKEERDGTLPAKLVWQGTDAKRRQLPDGLYNMLVEIWDVAGNHSGITHKLALKRSSVPIQVASVVRDGKTYLQVFQEDAGVVPVAEWSIKVSSLAGEALLKSQGGFLPVLLELPNLGVNATILCDIEAKDTLGNFMSLTETKVRVEGSEVQVAQKVETAAENWVEDF